MVNFKDTTGILILRPKSGQLLHGDFISNAEKLEQVQLSDISLSSVTILQDVQRGNLKIILYQSYLYITAVGAIVEKCNALRL